MTDPEGTHELNSIIEDDDVAVNSRGGEKATTMEISWDNLETTKKKSDQNMGLEFSPKIGEDGQIQKEGRSHWPNMSSGEEDGFRSASEAGEHGRNNEGTVDSAYFSSDSQEDPEGDVTAE